MAFATAIGAAQRDLRWDIPLARPIATLRGIAAHDKPLVVISPCSSQRARNYRNWSVENYAAVIEHLEAQHGARVVLTGGPSDLEKEYGAALAAEVRHWT